MANTALVLGGGGVTGVAWEVGMLAGLAAAGVDLTTADLVVGTSAGSVVGAQIACGGNVEEMYAAQLDGHGEETAARISSGVMATFAWAAARSRDPQHYRARIGKMALTAHTISEAERRRVIESRLPLRDWPDRQLRITAVDAESGEFAVFDRDTGVPLIDAIGASCAVPGVWPPVTIGGRRWMDGGIRSAANADLAADHAQVVVLAPIAVGFGPVASVASQVTELRSTARVAAVTPDKAARQAIGRNVLDPAHRAGAARAGRAQGTAAAEAVAAVWM